MANGHTTARGTVCTLALFLDYNILMYYLRHFHPIPFFKRCIAEISPTDLHVE